VSGTNSLAVLPAELSYFPAVVYPAEREEGSPVMVIVSQARGRLSLAISLLFLMALSACAPSNNAPVVADLTAEPGWLLPQGSAEVKCVASDPDGDELTYVWSASGGTISESVIRQAEGSMIDCVASDPDGDSLSYQWSAERGQVVGQGPVVEWLAPIPCADYIVTVTVTDSKGAKVSQSVTITVKKAG
jgi:hypothetical protein